MFFDNVEDLQSKFTFFDRLNTIVFAVWKDKKAIEFRDGSIQDLRILYMNYINEMRQQCNELALLNRELGDVLGETRRCIDQISTIAANPSIHGCYVAVAYGTTEMMGDTRVVGRENFIVGHNETQHLESIARTRVDLIDIDDVQLESAL